MLTPEYIAGIADSMIDIYSEVEDDIVADIARRIVKTGTITETAAWQIDRAKQAGYLNGDVTRILAKSSSKSDSEIAILIKEAGLKGLAYDDKIYRLAGLSPGNIESSPILSSLLLQGYDSTKKLLNNWTQTRALESETAFKNLCDKSYLRVITGTMDGTTAVRKAVQELARNGITSVAYPSGANHNTDYAVRRAVTTGINQTVAKLQLARADEMGTNLVEVTSHAGARPTHAVWQGQVYCISGHSRQYKDFYSATGYGDGDGLCGWNCYHSFYPYFEGLSGRSFSSDPSADAGRNNDEDYELSQQQRYYERQIRAAKRECIAYQAAVDSATDESSRMAFQDDYTSAAIKLKRREAKLTQFISQTGRTRLRERESTGVWSVGEAAKARGAAQSSHTQWLKSINATDTSLNTLAKYYSGKYNNTPEYQLLTRYAKDVQGGWISPLAGFGNYKTAIQRIDNELVGKTSVSGIVITGQSKHLIQRIIGTASDPEKHSPRSGVEVDDLINAVLNGKFKAPKTDEITGARSQLHFNDVCAVSINPDTGVIIQCNPY
jgi:hypothetical protein